MHLFTSFMLRAFLSILKDMLFIDGIGLPSDFTYQNGNAYFYIDKEVCICENIMLKNKHVTYIYFRKTTGIVNY